MENFEMVEKLVNTFGVSYEKAKEALEASNWDAIDAAIYLEREKNGYSQPAEENVQPESQPEQVAEEQEEKVNTEPKGSTVNNTRKPGYEWKEQCSKASRTFIDFLTLNTFVVKKSSGEVFLDIPIWLMILLFCAFFWAMIFIMVIVFIMGYRFSFSGPQLGKKNIKNKVEHVEEVTEEFVEKVKNTVAPDNVEPVGEEVKEAVESVMEEVVENTEDTAAADVVESVAEEVKDAAEVIIDSAAEEINDNPADLNNETEDDGNSTSPEA